MACRVQLATPAAAASPGAIHWQGRIIGWREPPTSPLTIEWDGSPYADLRHREQQPTPAMTPTNRWLLDPSSCWKSELEQKYALLAVIKDVDSSSLLTSLPAIDMAVE